MPKLSMVILLPEPEKFSSFEEDLQAARLEIILQALDFRSVAVSLPQFEFDSSFELAPVLAKMGMPHAFSDQADFSGMDDGDTLKISDVIHKAFVDVNEAGTEAAAATAVIMTTKAMPMRVDPVEFTANRPFLFLIRDIATRTILFFGRVVYPRSS